jgi:hypothetical protein
MTEGLKGFVEGRIFCYLFVLRELDGWVFLECSLSLLDAPWLEEG